MRKALLLAVAASALVGCGTSTTSFVKSETTLGRVVVYRNGVAYFERYADVTGDSLKLNVPQDKVDDFLKSLTVVDAQTGEPAPISYPSGQGSTGGTIDMKIGVAKGAGPHKLRLSYVTEAPSWKPSYRVVVDKAGKVDIQGWAIVDNTSGEDWKDVKLGVGASSAMSFRFDLKGLRVVQRETLQQNDLFAIAPPTGGSSFGGQGQQNRRVFADVSDDVITKTEDTTMAFRSMDQEQKSPSKGMPRGKDGKPTDARGGVVGGNIGGGGAGATAQNHAADPIAQMAQSINSTPAPVVIEGYASSSDGDKNAASLDRANKLRDQLVRNGVAPNRIVAVGKGEIAGRAGGARVLEAMNLPGQDESGKKTNEKEPATGTGGATKTGVTATPITSEPIGTSHFESTAAMTVPRGTSAMVSILRSQTDGEVVYLYDPESARGNAQYPFRTVRFKNPTDSALESGPVSVFGDGRFIGEGLAEPIPARSIAFVPFALDRQIVVERKDADRDDIARILTINRGVFSTEIKHTKKSAFTLYNRLGEKAVVYIRHTVAQGYKLTKAPDSEGPVAKDDRSEHLGGAHLFRIEIEPNGKADVAIEEATPVFRTTDIRTQDGMDLVRAYVSSAALEAPLKAQVQKLLDLNTEMSKIEQQIVTSHEQMAEYRQRMEELHSQIFTLKAVKTAGPLMAHLEKKLQEMSEKLSKATIDVVALQEKQMVARVSFQNGVGDLTLEDEKKTAAK